MARNPDMTSVRKRTRSASPKKSAAAANPPPVLGVPAKPPAAPAASADTEKQAVGEAQKAPVGEAQKAPVGEAQKAPVGEAQKAPVGEAQKAPVGAKGLLRAGLKALGEVRDDVVVRQSRIFEALLGIDTSALLPRGIDPSKASSTGDSKFEDLFDQRVARSLERLGMPSPQALTALCRQLEAINEHLQRNHAPPVKKTARKRNAAARKP